MTLLVGIVCKDGVVIGADGAATFGQSGGFNTIEQQTQKIDVIGDGVILVGTGEVGLNQRFRASVEEAWNNKLFQKDPVEVGVLLSGEAIKQFSRTNVNLQEIPYGSFVAFSSNKSAHLCEFGYGNFQPELKDHRIWYGSMGIGQRIADPFLGLMREVFWHEGQPSSYRQAIFVVTWTLRHAIKCNPGGINDPMQIAVLTTEKGKMKARILSEEELAEHQQSVEEAIIHLRDYPKKLKGEDQDTREPPKPAQS